MGLGFFWHWARGFVFRLRSATLQWSGRCRLRWCAPLNVPGVWAMVLGFFWASDPKGLCFGSAAVLRREDASSLEGFTQLGSMAACLRQSSPSRQLVGAASKRVLLVAHGCLCQGPPQHVHSARRLGSAGLAACWKLALAACWRCV
jgi:hypothetical protein